MKTKPDMFVKSLAVKVLSPTDKEGVRLAEVRLNIMRSRQIKSHGHEGGAVCQDRNSNMKYY